MLARLGPHAHAALARDETVPARRASAVGDPLDTLIRLFLLQLDVDEAAAAAALPLAGAIALGLVHRAGGSVRAALDVRPYGSAEDAPGTAWWVVSDLGTGLDGVNRPLPADHVLGVGGASVTLAQLIPRHPVGRAFDLGTGSGVQALHLATHAATVVASDLSARALRLAALTAGLSDVDLDLRQGSLYDPVDGERFDLVVSNPPFVVSPGAVEPRYTYRDAGLPGDEVCRRLARGAPAVLTEDGMVVMLANWLHRDGESWPERVGSWLPADLDAWVVQRDLEDPAAYVSTWLRDSGDPGAPGYLAAYDAWLGALEADRVTAVGFGWVVLRRTAGRPGVRLEEWPHAVEHPLGPYVLAQLERQRALATGTEADLLGSALTLAPGVVQDQHGEPGAEDPHTIVLRQQHALRRARSVGTELAAAAGACDGTLPLHAVLDAVATVLGGDPAQTRARLLPQITALVADGLLELPVDA